MKKISFFIVALFLGFGAMYAQTLTIDNQTNCDILFYSGIVMVGGTNYGFGSEAPGVSIIAANNTSIYTINFPPSPGQLPMPNYSGPPFGATAFIGFKFKLPGVAGPNNGGGYISATAPYTVSTLTPSGGCNGGNAYTVIWTGPASNPPVVILP